MSFAVRLKNRLIAKLITRFPALSRKFTAAYKPWESRGDIPWTPLTKPLAECRVALVTTAGIHHRSQRPFDMRDTDGDPTWRELHTASLFDDFLITHDYYDHSDAEKDPNIILPLDRLHEFVAEGRIGSLAETHYSFMGHIQGVHIAELVSKTAREVANRLKHDGIDLVILTPA